MASSFERQLERSTQKSYNEMPKTFKLEEAIAARDQQIMKLKKQVTWLLGDNDKLRSQSRQHKTRLAALEEFTKRHGILHQFMTEVG